MSVVLVLVIVAPLSVSLCWTQHYSTCLTFRKPNPKKVQESFLPYRLQNVREVCHNGSTGKDREDKMFHGMLHDSAVVGLAGHARHAAHKAKGRKQATVFGAFAQLATDLQKEKARKARKARKR